VKEGVRREAKGSTSISTSAGDLPRTRAGLPCSWHVDYAGGRHPSTIWDLEAWGFAGSTMEMAGSRFHEGDGFTE
jgi:hypothetical protein